ncbi:MAG: peptidoglycan-binding protein [Selenomonadaceae bacterium]|nr:peptidoglycan-binding protein [Selenomonadaceae bacterium]
MNGRRILWTLLLIFAVCFSNLCSAAALKYGDRGSQVKEIQEYLIAQNLLHVAADGVYGSATVNAIKDFQSALGLEVDGVCGAETYKLLWAAAFDKIDITTYQPGDYVPEPPRSVNEVVNSVNEVSTVLSAVNTVKEIVQYAGVGDTIKLGMEGEGVVHLQNKLTEHGFYDGEVDGVADKDTIDALKDFQSSRGMKADGICGRRTYSALDEEDTPTNLNDYEFSSDLPEYNGIPEFSRVIRVEATAYSSAQPGLSAYTATGTLCRHGVIATDPFVIPLGTRVYIPGYGYAVAEDTGGAIVGHKIDVAFDTLAECYEFGRQFIDIYIID